jgi:hypothetical protein
MKIGLRITSIIIATVLLATGIIFLNTPRRANTLSGSDWVASRIIDDAIFFNAGTMNSGDIQNFLNAKVPSCDTNGTLPKNGVSGQTRAEWAAATGNPGPPYICLRNFTQTIDHIPANAYCNGIGGGTKSGADIIFNVAQACNVNPRALIVLLEKEQSLVTDDWPWPIQYRSATGYGCPDTAACDSAYYGFFNQVYNAARQFRRYITNPNDYNYAVGRNSFVGYNPNSACGGTNVTMENQATAALYNYTPYQPNAAALANLNGLGDACSAYGNRNFWRIYNNWFGPTRSDSFTIALTDDGSNAQYLLFGGIKQAIPDPETKIAWGIQNYPVISMPASYLASIPSGPYLDRLTRLNTSDNTVFFMDGGKRYRVMSQAMFDAWNFAGRPITSVPPGLFYVPQDGGELTYTVKDPSSSTAYMLDGGNGSGQTIIRPFLNETIQKAWEGDANRVIPISSSFFNVIDNAVGSQITSTKLAFRGNEYQVMSGYKLPQPGYIAPLYPGAAQTYSDITFWRLAPGPTMTYLIKGLGGPEVYLVDGGVRHHVVSPDVLKAWTISNTPIIGVNTAYLDSIPASSSLSSYLADTGGQLFIIDKAKMPIPANLDAAYRNSSSVYPASASLLGILTTTPNQATGFIKARSSPAAYMLDNSGKKRHLEWADKVKAWAESQSAVMELSDYIVNSMLASSSPSMYVTDGTTNYVMDGGKKWTVSAPIATDWGLVNPQLFSDGTLGRFATAGALENEMRDKNGGYFIIKGGNAYGTADSNIAEVWSLQDGQVHDSGLVTGLVRVFMLTRFVRSSVAGDDRTFVINNGQWFTVDAAQKANMVPPNEPIMMLNPANAPNTITNWTSMIVKNSAGTAYVIDGGGKRYFMHQMVYDQWTNYGSYAMPTVSNGFLSLYPTKGYIERAIKGSGPAVYSAEAGTKRHILYPNTYNQYYAPYMMVTDQLLNAMPTGSPI